MDVAFHTFGLNAKRWSPPPPAPIHVHPEVEMNFVFSGGITYLHRGVMRRIGPGRLAVFWGSTPHGVVLVEPDTEMVWVTVPVAVVRGWGLPQDFMRSLMEGAWRLAPEGMGDRFPIRAWVRELPASGQPLGVGSGSEVDDGGNAASPRFARQHRLLHEIQACFLWLAEQGVNASARAVPIGDSERGLVKIEAMARCMAERFDEELRVSDIARAAGLHPNYAMRLFHKRCGVTIREYLVQHRVTQAQNLLLTRDDKVIDVAMACGFRSLSAFYDSFMRVVKESPQEYRRRMRL